MATVDADQDGTTGGAGRVACWAAALLAGIVTACGPAVLVPEPESAQTEAARAELVGDVVRLLGEAVAAHDAGRRVDAERRFWSAHAVFREHVAPMVRARDPEAALLLEYRLGRLGDALRTSRGDPDALWTALSPDLEAVRPSPDVDARPTEGDNAP